MYVKICGLRDASMVRHAAASGANAVGAVMSPGSSRDATTAEAREVAAAARDSGTDSVLVVRGHPAEQAVSWATEFGFDILQLHGDYTSEDFAVATTQFPRVWRAASLNTTPNLTAGEFGEERLLVDAALPGSGEQWDLDLIKHADLGAGWVLAGGLSPANVADAIRQAQPWGVDVSSGVEKAPGLKDPELISAFIVATRP